MKQKFIITTLLLALLLSAFSLPFAAAENGIDWSALENSNDVETTLITADESGVIDWQMVLSTILYSLLSTAVPLITVQLYRYLAAKREQIWGELYDTDLQRGVDAALDAVYTAVAQTNRTYVDALKDKNLFNKENQKAAFNLTMDTARELLTEAAAEAVETVYGSLETWLTAKIEQATSELKTRVISVTKDVEVADGVAADPFVDSEEPVVME